MVAYCSKSMGARSDDEIASAGTWQRSSRM
jgi:hypothetical protein